MEAFSIANFKFGLDSRRSELTSQPGTLQTLSNAHINPGGEIEKRKAFVLNATLGILDDGGDTGTFWLEVTDLGLVVFGSALPFGASSAQSQAKLASAIPAGYTYIQLRHPVLSDDASATYSRTVHRMTAVVASCNFNGKPVVAVRFADSNVFLFYGETIRSGDGTASTYYRGTIIDDSRNGIVLTGKTSLASLGTDLARIANAQTGWRGTANVDISGNATNGAVQIYTPPGVYAGTPVASNNSVAGLQASQMAVTLDGQGTAATSAKVQVLITGNGTFSATAPKNSDGSGTAALTGGTVTAAGTADLTADAVVLAINNNSVFTGYSAVKVASATFVIFAPAAWGALANGFTLTTGGTATITVTSGPITTGITLTCTLNTQAATVNKRSSLYTYSPAQPTAIANGGVSSSYTFTWRRVLPNGQAWPFPDDGLHYNLTGASLSVSWNNLFGVPTSSAHFICQVSDGSSTDDSPILVLHLTQQ